MRGNTITIEMSDRREKMAKTIPLYQYDYGQKLILENVELPSTYEVHFSNEIHGEAVTVIGDSTGVEIPNQLLTTGKDVYLWLFLHDEETDGETERVGVIPVIKRAHPIDEDPPPEQRSLIMQLLDAANEANIAATAAITTASQATTAIAEATTAVNEAATAVAEAISALNTAMADIESKADILNPVFENSISLGRKEDTYVGQGSVALGYNVEASGGFAEGSNTVARGGYAHAKGCYSQATGYGSDAGGFNTLAQGMYQHVFGMNNVGEKFETWEPGKHYNVGDGADVINESTNVKWLHYCIVENSDEVFDPAKWEIEINRRRDSKYVEIVGNGWTGNARSNARTLDWNGNESIAGGLTLGAGTVNEATITAEQLTQLLALLN